MNKDLMIVNHETTERVFDDEVKFYHVLAWGYEYNLTVRTMGAYDEDGNKDIGIGATVTLYEVTKNETGIFDEIYKELDTGDYELYLDTDTIMINAPDTRKYLDITTYNSPDEVEEIFHRIIGTIALYRV